MGCYNYSNGLFEIQVKLPKNWVLITHLFFSVTWQVDDDWFSPVLYDFLMEFINIGPVYIREWVGGARGGVGGGKSFNKEEIRYKE